MTARRSAAADPGQWPLGAGRAGNRCPGDLWRAGARPWRGAHRRRCACAGAGGALRYCETFRAGPFPRWAERTPLRPHPIAVLSAEIVPDTFEARFSAKKRHYLYRISNRRANLALDIGHVWRLPRPLDTDAMHAGRAKTGRQARLHHLSRHRMPGQVARENPRPARRHQEWRCRRHRDIGALVPAQPGALDGGLTGLGRRRPLETPKISPQRWPSATAPPAARSAPPDGLYLVRVDY